MTDCPDCADRASRESASRQLGVGHYVGRVACSVAVPNCHLSAVIHATPGKLPEHAHDWPFLSTLLRGSYVSRTRTREMEFRHGISVYHPGAFQHSDEIGRDGGLFFGVQLNPALLLDADRASPQRGRDLVTLDDSGAYIVLGSLYAALRSGSSQLVFESLAAELANRLMEPELKGHVVAPAWLKRTEHRLQEEEHPSLEELALDAGVHVTTLTRLFRRHKKCSIGQFHARARARRAFFAVVGSSAPLSEICHDAGYSDQSHMTRDFRRSFGATPGQLRRTVDA